MDTKTRTQAERRATTRRTLLDATIDMLMEAGLRACSLAAVAQRAGMTTGAVQHHFKTKADLMRAVISERLFAQDQSIDWHEMVDSPVAERCKKMIDYQWRFYKNPKYIAIWDMILGARSDEQIQTAIREWQSSGTRSLETAIAKAFSDQTLKKSDIRAIQYFMNAHLRGLALLRTVQDEPRIIKDQLAMLSMLLTEFIRNR